MTSEDQYLDTLMQQYFERALPEPPYLSAYLLAEQQQRQQQQLQLALVAMSSVLWLIVVFMLTTTLVSMALMQVVVGLVFFVILQFAGSGVFAGYACYTLLRKEKGMYG